MEVKELLQLQASITNELINRDVVRTQNNPLGDYTEWLVAKALDLDLEAKIINHPPILLPIKI